MDNTNITKVLDTIIRWSFYALFAFVPLVVFKVNYELFEYNKMMLTYALTVIIAGTWIAKMIVSKKLILRPTPFDIPIALFFLSQVISYIFSMDRHVSLWGYYSRFNGGLLSTITYIVLFYALVSNFSNFQFSIFNFQLNKNNKKSKSPTLHFPLSTFHSSIHILILISLITGLIVSIYGILEHFGFSFSCLLFTGTIGVSCWVQDVQNRVFATLGQPNWMAAYLAILIPISVALFIKECVESGEWKVGKKFIFYFLFSTFYYTALLFTKSRSGFLGVWTSLLFLSTLLIYRYKELILKPLSACMLLFLFLTFIISSPFDQINSYLSLQGLSSRFFHLQPTTYNLQPQGSALETGGTESGDIRKIVWKGAIDIAKAYPLFGTGVETFAFAYYKFRPVEHNTTSEWDFLYNKAHNEYLNYLATTGIFGLGTYLLFIGWFVIWLLLKIKNVESRIKNQEYINTSLLIHNSYFLILGLFSGWLSILITNFFGFSVVVVALYFWLIPAMCVVLVENNMESHPDPPAGGEGSRRDSSGPHTLRMTTADIYYRFKIQYILLVITFLTTLFLLFTLIKFWNADTHFAKGYNAVRADQYTKAYEQFIQAINLNPGEPVYHDEFSADLSTLALAAYQQKEATLSAMLEKQAVQESNFALLISPQNINFWKTRTRVFYALGEINEEYNQDAYVAISQAAKLAPTDAKIAYNKGLIEDHIGQRAQAVQTLLHAVALKPNYRDPRYALAVLYAEQGEKVKAVEQLQYILQYISPKDEEAKKKLDSLQ